MSRLAITKTMPIFNAVPSSPILGYGLRPAVDSRISDHSQYGEQLNNMIESALIFVNRDLPCYFSGEAKAEERHPDNPFFEIGL